MARKSNKPTGPPSFKNEAEEGDWWDSPAGRRFASEHMNESVRNGTAKIKSGVKMKRTDPAVLQALVDRVAAKQTQAVSIRLPNGDIGAAKKIAQKTGIGYQTVLKEIMPSTPHCRMATSRKTGLTVIGMWFQAL
jgi:hypothetical protein